MPIVGFNFNKILVEKKSQIKQKIQISSNVAITDIKEEKLPTGKSKVDGLRFDFKFELKYEPKVGEISLHGFIYYLDDPKIMKDVLKGWKKDKSIPPAITEQIINTVLYRGNIRALSLSQDVNLPPHIQMPRIARNTSKKSYIG